MILNEDLGNVLGGFEELKFEEEGQDGGKEVLFSVRKKLKDFRCDFGGRRGAVLNAVPITNQYARRWRRSVVLPMSSGRLGLWFKAQKVSILYSVIKRSFSAVLDRPGKQAQKFEDVVKYIILLC